MTKLLTIGRQSNSNDWHFAHNNIAAAPPLRWIIRRSLTLSCKMIIKKNAHIKVPESLHSTIPAEIPDRTYREFNHALSTDWENLKARYNIK